jgi:hypothetical protein
MNELTFAQVTVLLAGCVRHELVDHAFGDAEVTWMKGDIRVADGYFGKTKQVSPSDPTAPKWRFEGVLAHLLRRLGTAGSYERNDSGEER